MGCLNSNRDFEHWFGNIHLSGPCNRSCYFCIGQHMMGLDSLNTLDVWPLPGIEKFVSKCCSRGVTQIYLTGTNTDPLLYRHIASLKRRLADAITGLSFGVRTNGVGVLARLDDWRLFDKASVTVCSLDHKVYRSMMGEGSPPNLPKIMGASRSMKDFRVNVVLGPENALPKTPDADIFKTLAVLCQMGVKKVNVREPYGQPYVGDPLAPWLPRGRTSLGMPVYDFDGRMEVMYWDVHFVEVESVNLYASGIVSEDYPITRGHDPFDGCVREQNQFPGGRITEQWVQIT